MMPMPMPTQDNNADADANDDDGQSMIVLGSFDVKPNEPKIKPFLTE